MNEKLIDTYAVVAEKAEAFLQKVVEFHNDADFKSVFAIAAQHNFKFNLPSFQKEFDALVNSLDSLRQAKDRDQQSQLAEVIDLKTDPANK